MLREVVTTTSTCYSCCAHLQPTGTVARTGTTAARSTSRPIPQSIARASSVRWPLTLRSPRARRGVRLSAGRRRSRAHRSQARSRVPHNMHEMTLCSRGSMNVQWREPFTPPHPHAHTPMVHEPLQILSAPRLSKSAECPRSSCGDEFQLDVLQSCAASCVHLEMPRGICIPLCWK